MKKLLLLSLILTLNSSSTYAEVERISESLIDLVEELSSDSPTLLCREGAGKLPEGEEDQSELINRCMIDLCDPPTINSTTTLTEYNMLRFMQEEDTQINPQLRERITQVTQQEHERNLAMAEEASRLIRDGDLFNNQGELYEETWHPVVQSIFHNYVQIRKNPQSLNRSQRFTVEVDRRLTAGLSEERIAAIEDYSQQLQNYVQNGPWFAAIEFGSVSDQAMINIARENFDRIKAEIIEAHDNDTVFRYFQQGEELDELDRIEAFLSNQNPEEFDRVKLVGAMRRLRWLHADTTGTNDEITTPLCQDGPCREGVNTFLQQMNASQIVDQIRNANPQNAANSIYQDCRVAIIGQRIQTPDISNIMAHYPDIVKNFNTRVLARASAHSKTAFNRIQKQELEILGLGKGERGYNLEDAFISDFGRRSEALTASEPRWRDPAQSEVLAWIFEKSRLSLQNMDGPAQANAFSSVNSCAGRRPETGGDSFQYNPESREDRPYKISLSPHSCTHISAGKANLAHEMGHFLSSLFETNRLSEHSKQDYMRLRNCSSQSYKEMTPLEGRKAFFEGDHFKTEEDTADMISMLALSGDVGVRPDSCSLLHPNNSGSGYNHSTLIYRAGSHSAPPLRVLVEAIHQDRNLSVACRKLLEPYNDRLRFGKCFSVK